MPNLLLVDDDLAVLNLLRASLADLADLRVARRGADALQQLQQHKPDLLLLDLHLADTDGLALLQALRADPALADLPVIFLSADADPGQQVRALNMDALDWLAKPSDPLRLRARVQAALRRAAAARPPHAPVPPESLLGACVLAVDDDPIVLEALRGALAPAGYRVLCAGSAAQGAALALAEAPEVVLIDMVMPGEDGFALARRLVAMPCMADAQLIFVTQYGDTTAEVRALAMGAFDFIGKPVQPAVLRARVANALRLRRRTVQNAQTAEARWRRLGTEQLAHIVSHSRDAIVTVDGQGRLLLANDAARQFLGTEQALLAGARAPAWLLDALPAPVRAGTQKQAVRLELGPPGGLRRVCDVWGLADEAGGTPLLTLTLQDQTDRLQQEARAQAQAKAQVQAESQSRQLMLSYVAHELGNPLNAVLGLTRLVLHTSPEPITDEQRRRLGMVLESADVMRHLIQDLRDLARWQAGRFRVQLMPMSLAPALASVLEGLQAQAARAQITLRPPQGDLGVQLMADEARIYQCLSNLLSNACKYGRPGGQVGVEVSAGDAEAAIAVSDDGPGLTPEQVARLFRPYERLGRSGPSGEGLGLAVTRMLAEAMNGRLEVQSQVGQGSRFTLVLPLASSTSAPVLAASAKDAPDA